MTLRGTPFLYYGEELGLENGKISYKERRDLLGKHYWPFYHGRDPFRTPMPWGSEDNGNFSQSKPWLPLSPHSIERNVRLQKKDEKSYFNFCEKLIKIRKKEICLTHGTIQFLDEYPQVLSFIRSYQKEKIKVMISFGKKDINLPSNDLWIEILNTDKSNSSHLLKSWGAKILKHKSF